MAIGQALQDIAEVGEGLDVLACRRNEWAPTSASPQSYDQAYDLDCDQGCDLNGHAAALDNSSCSPQMIHNWFINIACSRQIPTRRLNRSAPAIVSTFSGTFLHCDYTGRPRARAAQIPLAPVLVLHVPHEA